MGGSERRENPLICEVRTRRLILTEERDMEREELSSGEPILNNLDLRDCERKNSSRSKKYLSCLRRGGRKDTRGGAGRICLPICNCRSESAQSLLQADHSNKAHSPKTPE